MKLGKKIMLILGIGMMSISTGLVYAREIGEFSQFRITTSFH